MTAKHRRQGSAVRSARTLGTTSAILAGAVVLGLAGAGGTYALWNRTATVNAGTVTSGSVGLTVNAQTSYDIGASSMTGVLLPGRSRITTAPLAVSNTGTTPLSVTAGTPVVTGALASELNVAIRQVAGSGSSCTPTATGATPVTLTAPVVVAAGATIYVCVEAQLKTTAPASAQGASAQFTIPLAGTQVH
ncbi:MAG: SipW-dependent-type signal peptide-containing protein [Protaetiibacter sp.]